MHPTTLKTPSLCKAAWVVLKFVAKFTVLLDFAWLHLFKNLRLKSRLSHKMAVTQLQVMRDWARLAKNYHRQPVIIVTTYSYLEH